MDIIQYTTQWAKGDMIQGRIMLFIGILVLIAGISILKGNHVFLKGTLIPMALFLVLFLGYGGVLTFTRSSHVSSVESLFSEDPKAAVQKEYEKAKKDNKAYNTLKPIWVGLIILCAILYFVFSSSYLKGLTAGFIGLFFSLLIVDTALQDRLTPYLEKLIEHVKGHEVNP